MPDIKTPDDIESLHGEYLTRHQPRIDQQIADEALWRLERYTLEEVETFARTKSAQYPSFTSNAPRTFANVIITSLGKWPVRFKGETYQVEGEAQQDEISVHERFAQGLWRRVDEVRARRVEMGFQWDLAWFHAVRGGSCIRVWLSSDFEDPFDVMLFDPIDCVWDVGVDGLSYFSRNYLGYKYDVEDRWGYQGLSADESGNVKVWDAWWQDSKGDVYNGVMTAKEILKPITNETKVRKQKRIPIIVTRSAGSPVGETVRNARGKNSYQVDRWDSIYAPNRDMYRWFNRTASLFGIYLRNNVLGPWVSIGEKVPGIEQAMKPFSVLEKPNGSFGPVAMPEIAQSAKEFFAMVQGEAQRGSVPYSIFGQLPFELTGVAISQLQGAIDIVLDPQRNAMRSAYRAATDEAISQFVARGRKVRLSGTDRRGVPWWDDFTRQRLATKYFMDVEVRADLPLLKQQEAVIAGQWQKLGVSLLTIYDELLHFQDPAAEYRRWLAEQADQDPMLATIKKAEELIRRARVAGEAGYREEAQRFQMYAQVLLRQQMGGGQRGQGGQAALPPPELGSPEMMGRETGEFVPSEQMVGVNERMRAMGMEMAQR